MHFYRFVRAVAAAAILMGVSGPGRDSAMAQPNPLITGRRISLPVPGTHEGVGSLPMNLILSPDGRYAISSDMGFRQSLCVIDTRTGKRVSQLDFTQKGAEGLYYGLAATWNGDHTLVYASQGANATVLTASLDRSGKLTQTGTLHLKPGDLVAGIAVDRRGYLYCAINTFSVKANDLRVMTSPGALAILDTRSGKEIGRWKFGKMLSNFPYAVEALANGTRAFVTSQRDGTVSVLDTTNPAAIRQIAAIPTGAHPIALRLNRAQTRLYVANAHSDSISEVEVAANRVTATIALRPAVLPGLAGATPTGLALSKDEKRLYVTLGDMNAVALVNIAAHRVEGYLPTGWHPTAVVATERDDLLYTIAKGIRTRTPNGEPSGPKGAWGTYTLSILEGAVTRLEAPDQFTLQDYTRQVIANNMPPRPITANPLPPITLKDGKIKHVIYIVKENRTYDQVLGDLKAPNNQPLGNGDPKLTLYGEAVTPNQHELARRFVTLDNFYDCGEASGDGWPWSTQGIANEYVIKNLPYNYSGRGRKYDFEGQNNGYPVGGFPAVGPDGTPLVSKLSPLSPSANPIADVSESPGGHIWDSALRAGLTVRNYGFFLNFGVSLGKESILPDNYPSVKPLQPAGHDLAGISDYDFRRFDGSYPDSDAPQTYYEQRKRAGAANAGEALYSTKTYGKHNAPSRFSEWNTEFQQMLAKDPTGGSVPNLMLVRFMNDHTVGVRTGAPTPDAQVADNDYAVGQLVEAVSKSPIWESTAIFVLEDDAQDGQDHIDCHRSTCFVISPYIKHSSVDHRFYNTDSVLRTIGLLLGLPPMTQYDAIAEPIQDWDGSPMNNAPYEALLPEEEIICKRGKAGDKQAKLDAMTRKLDFTHADAANPALLNAILWKYAHGVDAMPPAPKRRLPITSIRRGARKTASKERDD